jgi:hypothetical protein
MKKVKVTTVLILLIFLGGASLFAQQESQSIKLLRLKQAQLSLQEKEGDFNRALKLKEEGLISEEDFARKRTAYLQAQVSYQEALINFLGSEARISVVSAVKYQDNSGKKMVRVTLRYSSKELKELERLNIDAQDLFPLDFIREIKDVFVSLQSEGRIISDPYEKTISSMPLESERQVTFQLLKDVENLGINVFYAGREESTAVYLQKGLSANIVTINSAQFSQEADLESQATFDLSLEKFSGEANVFKLMVLNLPNQITYEFVDPQTQARLSQIKFTEGITSMQLSLRLYLPKNADDEVVMDQSIEFFALAMDSTQEEQLLEIMETGARIEKETIEELRLGHVRLELIPRGVGRIEVQAVNLYHEINTGENVKMDVRIRNTGTRRLNNIRIYTDLPINWRSEVTPDLIPILEQNKEEVVTLEFIPPVDVSVGDYEPRIRTECIADNRRVESEDKIVRIHISAKTNVVGITLLIVLLIGLLVGIVIFGIKLTRR